MGYANSKMIPFVALVGENEMNEGKVTLKNMETGEQKLITDMKAQARFVRAYYYWLLLRKYGPVPLLPDEGLSLIHI